MLKHWVGGRGSHYHDAVWRAVVDAEEQAVFRRNQAYHDILGVADYHARAYFEHLNNKEIIDLLFRSENADRIGGPVTYDFSGHQLAPNTVRYAKVLQDLVEFFPDFSSFEDIAEIGVGYGGQARLVSEYKGSSMTRLKTYHLIDILPVCLLAQAYLDHFRLHTTCHYMTKSQISRDGRWDLVISNYAFSEFDADLEREYLDLVLLRSRSGYLTMNSGLSDSGQWQSIGQSCIGVEELLATLPNAVLLPEHPALTPSNYIIVFGEHSLGEGVPLKEIRSLEAERLVEHNQWLENMRQAAATPSRMKTGVSDATPIRKAARGRAVFKMPFKR